jgi:hypothetical protein
MDPTQSVEEGRNSRIGFQNWTGDMALEEVL